MKGEEGIVERKKAPGFKAAVRVFLEWSEQQHKSHPATFRRYRVSSAALLRHFKDQPLDPITVGATPFGGPRCTGPAYLLPEGTLCFPLRERSGTACAQGE